MLFNSIPFLFVFLPCVLGGFWLLRKYDVGRFTLGWIALASLIFYAWWDVRYLALLVTSVVVNYYLGERLSKHNHDRLTLWVGVGLNLLCLAVFKYFNFFIDSLNGLGVADLTVPSIILPLGVSFFTFQQIAYLVDARQGKIISHSFVEYLVFVTFFPQLIAGPIVHHKDMMPQFFSLLSQPYDWGKAAMGLSIFIIGLFKKVVLADEFAAIASPIFTQSEGLDAAISFGQGWLAALAYSCQLYFDFSGYSDMAIGLGLLFGVKLPVNFLSPYKATSIIEFWQRWHVTLSQFLKDYLYIPLGGNRKGHVRRYINLMITMLLGGLWHGAGWGFILWGGLHGLYLCVNHFWRSIMPAGSADNWLRRIFGWLMTMVAVIVAWVVFRATSVDSAWAIITAMFDVNAIQGIDSLMEHIALLVLGFAIILSLPNVAQIFDYLDASDQGNHYSSWQQNKRWIAGIVIMMLVSLYIMVYQTNRISEFIYFQF